MSINGLSSITQAADRSGLVLVAKTDFSAASTVSVDGCFTATYDNYMVALNVVASGSTTLRMRMRTSAPADESATQYYVRLAAPPYSGGAIAAVGNTNAGTSWYVCGISSTLNRLITMQIGIPAVADLTTIQIVGADGSQGIAGGGYLNTSTAYPSFTIYPDSGTITGTVRCYGYRNNV